MQWCETQKDCNRLRLIDILVRPMQRLTKYALLLKAILKKTEDEEQGETLKIMAKKVESFVSHVNSHLRQRQENERLKTIIARIDSYEPIVMNPFHTKFTHIYSCEKISFSRRPKMRI